MPTPAYAAGAARLGTINGTPVHSRSTSSKQVSSHERLCAWCFEPLGDVATELNGGIGHPWCAQYAYECVAGPGAIPWRPHRQFYREDQLNAFLERLGRAALRRGIDKHKLARAIEEACGNG